MDKEVKDKVSVIICALNEEENLRWVLSRVPAGMHEVLLVDGYSSDKTIELAKKTYPGVKVICQEGKGKGAALRTGFRHAAGDIILTIDADCSMDPTNISHFTDALHDGNDFVKGSRFLRKNDSEDITPLRHFGNRLFAWLTCILYGFKATDVTYGYNAFWNEKYPSSDLRADHFGIETEMYIRAIKARVKIKEIAIHEFKRQHGSGKLRSFRDGWLILMTIIALRFKR
jgi:glycosyltransferase involved in cell wall biosynthesis